MSSSLLMICPVNNKHIVKERAMFSGEKFSYCTECRECTKKLSEINIMSDTKYNHPTLATFREMSFQERFDLVVTNLFFHRTDDFSSWPVIDQNMWELIREKAIWADSF